MAWVRANLGEDRPEFDLAAFGFAAPHLAFAHGHSGSIGLDVKDWDAGRWRGGDNPALGFSHLWGESFGHAGNGLRLDVDARIEKRVFAPGLDFLGSHVGHHFCKSRPSMSPRLSSNGARLVPS